MKKLALLATFAIFTFIALSSSHTENIKIEKTLKKSKDVDLGKLGSIYQKAYICYYNKEYTKTVKLLEKVIDHKHITVKFYKLLGNSYTDLKQNNKALEVFKSGIDKFPNSGKLYLEIGLIEYNMGYMDEALDYWEQGIKMDPTFTSNYYWTAKSYANTSEKIWVFLYGELFINLEATTERTKEISKLLFDTYKSSLLGVSGKSLNFRMTNIISNNTSKQNNEANIYFEAAYEFNLEKDAAKALDGDKEITIKSLSDLRAIFIENWYQNNWQKKYPNIIFDWHKKLSDNGHLEAYNHWILSNGDLDEFKLYNENNKENFKEFLDWYDNNLLEISDKRKFYQEQY